MEKKVMIYGASRRDPLLNPKVPEDVSVQWTDQDEVWETMGLERWDATIADLSAQVQARRINNYVEVELNATILDQSPVSEAKLLRKYKGIRFFDEDEDDAECRGYYRIRGDRLAWKGKKSGGWVVNCDKVTSNDPASDPQEDAEINDEYPEPYSYLINAELHRMISLARQAPGILLIAEGAEA
jgi:hypothetical protein